MADGWDARNVQVFMARYGILWDNHRTLLGEETHQAKFFMDDELTMHGFTKRKNDPNKTGGVGCDYRNIVLH